ncbi:hypothetical protein EVAR_78378_1 [Eumeta japonica]|uniref:Uncharacterized protein n=1 Tax=Eumeta variegata TaxID=151549 RepID=A0A4C1T3E2_EUMVA|nr:hypothetical protein EVAR_78378_1 [Eumeta japonica]
MQMKPKRNFNTLLRKLRVNEVNRRRARPPDGALRRPLPADERARSAESTRCNELRLTADLFLSRRAFSKPADGCACWVRLQFDVSDAHITGQIY